VLAGLNSLSLRLYIFLLEDDMCQEIYPVLPDFPFHWGVCFQMFSGGHFQFIGVYVFKCFLVVWISMVSAVTTPFLCLTYSFQEPALGLIDLEVFYLCLINFVSNLLLLIVFIFLSH
jgi:hypothetical protein